MVTIDIVHNIRIYFKIEIDEREFASSWRTRRPRFVAQALAVCCPGVRNPRKGIRRGTNYFRDTSRPTRCGRASSWRDSVIGIALLRPRLRHVNDERRSTLSRGIVGQYFLREPRAPGPRASTKWPPAKAIDRAWARTSEKTPRFSLSPFLTRFLLRPRSSNTYRCICIYIYV